MGVFPSSHSVPVKLLVRPDWPHWFVLLKPPCAHVPVQIWDVLLNCWFAANWLVQSCHALSNISSYSEKLPLDGLAGCDAESEQQVFKHSAGKSSYRETASSEGRVLMSECGQPLEAELIRSESKLEHKDHIQLIYSDFPNKDTNFPKERHNCASTVSDPSRSSQRTHSIGLSAKIPADWSQGGVSDGRFSHGPLFHNQKVRHLLDFGRNTLPCWLHS